jgi:hypothetical protein
MSRLLMTSALGLFRLVKIPLLVARSDAHGLLVVAKSGLENSVVMCTLHSGASTMGLFLRVRSAVS